MNKLIDKEIRNFFINFVSLAGARLIFGILSILSVIVTTRVLGPSNYGVLSLLVGLAQFFFMLSAGWTSGSVVRFGREELIKENSVNKLFWSRFIIVSIGIFIIGIIIWMISDFLAAYLSVQKNLLCFTLLYTIVFMTADYSNYLLQVFGQMKLYAVSLILERGSYLLLLGVFIFLSIYDSALKIVFIVLIGAKLIQTIFNIIPVRREMLFPFIIDRHMLKDIFKYSLPVLLFFPTAYISEYGDLWVIKFYLAVSYVGVYQLAYQGLLFLTQLYMVITVLLFPLFTSLKNQDKENIIKEFLKRSAPQIIFLWTIAISILILSGDYIFLFLFGRNFESGRQAFIILLSAVTFIGISGIYSAVNSSYDLLKYSMSASFFTVILNIVGDFLLIPIMGIKGAAFATLVSYAVRSYFYMSIGNRRLKVKTPLTFFVTLPVFITLFISLSFDYFILRILLFVVVFTIITIIVKNSKFFKKEDLRIFKKIEKPKIIDTILENLYICLGNKTIETVVLEQRYET